MHENRKPKAIPLERHGRGAALSEFCPTFVEKYSRQINGAEGVSRSWYLEPESCSDFSHHGIVRYGSTGYSEEIRDRKTRAVQYNRVPSDIGTIPLYYRIWVPENGAFGLLALQTFGSRSCVGRFRDAFLKDFRSMNKDIMLTFPTILPSDVAKYRDGQVKTFSLVKHNYSSDAAENQLGSKTDLVDLDVTFKAKPRGTLGSLRDFSAKVVGAGRDRVMEYNNTNFDEATAEVLVGGKKRKITLVGISKNAGKFDLTEDVDTIGGHPKFTLIASECEKLFSSILAE
jgi:hypothetical protein